MKYACAKSDRSRGVLAPKSFHAGDNHIEEERVLGSKREEDREEDHGAKNKTHEIS